jgi:hypothetical protein
MHWNRKTYDALYDWPTDKRPAAEKILVDNGGQAIVNELKSADSLGRWWQLCREAANAVGSRIVESSATVAEQALGPYRRS